MKKLEKRVNLGICILRILVDSVFAVIGTVVFISSLGWESTASIYPVVIGAYVLCLGVIAADLYFIIKDIRFIVEKARSTEKKDLF
jgi:hypothetical protein